MWWLLKLDVSQQITEIDNTMTAEPTAGALPDGLPRRKVKTSVFDLLRNLRKLTTEKGGLVPIAGAATILGVTKQRVHELVKEGTLHPVEFLGKKWLSGEELLSFVKLQRDAGRPWKEPSIKEQWRAARDGHAEQFPPDEK
jgi:hypothetical protein